MQNFNDINKLFDNLDSQYYPGSKLARYDTFGKKTINRESNGLGLNNIESGPVSNNLGNTITGIQQEQELNKLGNGDIITDMAGIKSIQDNNNELSNIMNIVGTGSSGPINHNASNRGNYIRKLWKEESNNNPNAINPTTKAYGLNQIMPEYAQWYADQAKISLKESRTTPGQLKLANNIYDRTTNYMKKHNINDTELNRYGLHQQGFSGYRKAVQGNGNDSAIRQNIPVKFLANAPSKEKAFDTWNRYWKTKFNA